MQPQAARRSKQGTTFVEVILAAFILSILAVGGAAYLTHARGETLTQRNKRVALETANQRLEELRTSSYDEIKPLLEDYDVHYLEKQGSTWNQSDTDPGETVTLNGLGLPIQTTVQYMDADGGAQTYDYIYLTARVGFRAGKAETISLETYLSP